jgi:AcrR family transcriptional regulator
MTTSRRRPGPRRTLTEDGIVTAALGLLDAHGAGGLSARRIAAELDVAPNALYTYFPDMAAVERAVVDRLIGDRDPDPLDDLDRPWRERLHGLAAQLRERLLAHPGAAGLMMSAPVDGPQALLLGERLLELLAEAGLEPADAARASYLLIVYVLGAIALEAAELDPTVPVPPEEERIAAREATFAQVPAELFPRTAAATHQLARSISTEQFRWGLDRVLDGLAR